MTVTQADMEAITRSLRRIEDGFNKLPIPDYMQGGIRRYVGQGVPAGDFLTAVFRNDFMDAATRADLENGSRNSKSGQWETL